MCDLPITAIRLTGFTSVRLADKLLPQHNANEILSRKELATP